MKTIQLTKGYKALVDDEDYDYLNQWKWHCNGEKYAARVYYIVKNKKKIQKVVYMHREIMQTPRGFVTDHIDGNGFNNQRINLRICTHAHNISNQQKQNRLTISRYKGLAFIKTGKKIKRWRATVRVKGKSYWSPHYLTEEEAAKAYNKMAKKKFGEYARLNTIL